MSKWQVTVVVPTLTAGEKLVRCLRSLKRQTLAGVEILIVDNSGFGAARPSGAERLADTVIENSSNAGFGAAINQGIARSTAPYVATLNDDAVASPGWLAGLVGAMEADPSVGMCASKVVLAGTGRMDSAGMLICGDGTSKQRGHGRPAEEFDQPGEVLFPSGSAALYRRSMLEETGGFDDDFFLYCEDTDLGLRARRAGWICRYVPEAVVEHGYSQSAGRASSLKAYLVERNRLFVVFKNFPAGMILQVPFFAVTRYVWHVFAIRRGHGAAAEFHRDGNNPLRLVWYVLKSHLALLARAGRIWRQRRKIVRRARLSNREFRELLARHSIGPKEVTVL